MLSKVQINLSTVYLLAIFSLQLWLIFNLQLFGDESFYWLEGQFLSLSYSELPGWTAWMIRLGTSIFGNNYFGVRIVSYLGFLSLLVAITLINNTLNHKLKNQLMDSSQKSHQYLMVLSIPLFVLLAVMALPDIWLIFFVVWIIYFFIKAFYTDKLIDWMILGIVLALSLNVHVRMWIWLVFAGLSLFYCFRSNHRILKSVFLVTLPIAIIGLIPVIMFNYQNDFALFSFQFGQRHPWKYQAQNFIFIVSQFIVITPVILWLWISNIFNIKQYINKQPLMAWILLTALTHWLFYVVMSVFVDGLRTTVHWLLISYVPVLVITPLLKANKFLIKYAIISGAMVSLVFLSFISFNKGHSNNLQARIMDNSLGWDELSKVVKRLQKQHKTEYIIADYFMTASELAFELDNIKTIRVLPHPKNRKHGRQKQLQIMGLLLDKPHTYVHEALLVVEDSGLKLQNKGKYYTDLCQNFNQVMFLESITIDSTKKQFHVFKVNNMVETSLCQIPPLFYVQQKLNNEHIEISGWAILHNSAIQSLSIVSKDESILIENNKIINTGIKSMFPEILDKNLPRNGFKIIIPKSKISNNAYQVVAISVNNKKYFSQYYFID